MDKVRKNIQKMYDEYRQGHQFIHEDSIEKNEGKTLFRFLSLIQPGKTVYDIGCGAGFWLTRYIRRGITKHQITAVDISHRNIEQLKQQGFYALWGDAMNLPFEDNVADFTICNGVIHHVVDPLKAFSELVRITRGRGYIYLTVNNMWNPYFYFVYKLTFPIRYFYWNYSKKIFSIVYHLTKIIFQPLAFVLKGQFFDDHTGQTIFMDQVMTPRNFLFSKSKLMSYAKRYHCEIEHFAFEDHYLLIACIIKVNKKHSGD